MNRLLHEIRKVKQIVEKFSWKDFSTQKQPDPSKPFHEGKIGWRTEKRAHYSKVWEENFFPTEYFSKPFEGEIEVIDEPIPIASGGVVIQTLLESRVINWTLFLNSFQEDKFSYEV